MLKRTLACALFAITGHAYSADIQVTTLVDDENYTGCSLRNAIEFLNKRDQKEYENGYMGCGNKDSSSIIILQRDKEYLLNKQVDIKASLTISTISAGDFSDIKKGLHNATIKMKGTDRIFNIDDGTVEKELINVSLNELNLQGSNTKVLEGGLILNRENLLIQYSRLSGGNATFGGAINNKGILSDKNTAGKIYVNNSILENNEADQGAVIYSDMPRYFFAQSVLKNNKVNKNGAILYVDKSFNDEAIAAVLATGFSGIRNSTILNNKGGYLANIREGMTINNITAIYNDMGFYLEAPKWNSKVTNGNDTSTTKEPSAFITNSIITKNNINCVAASNDETVIQTNLTENECNRNASVGNPNYLIGNNQLVAGGVVESDNCDFPQDQGLLCPYSTPKDQMLGFFQPRLLTSYQNLSQSLIVNKGRIYSDGNTLGLVGCESVDQRGKSRSLNAELCDLGAIELVVNRSDIQIAGGVILYGELAKFNISNSLLDGELLDAESCKVLLKREFDSKGQPWQSGCLEIEQTETVSKGKLSLDNNGNVQYTPNGNWHGADKFNIRVITTITRLNNASNYYIDIPVSVLQNPPNRFESKTVNVGSFNLTWVLVLFGLLGLRRFKS
ncbi:MULTISPECIES: rhombotarget A [Acinetobacter]|uniref:rhombotarget A n=1 Tax=Acinetobacter TaxID=469 RepID=UPI0020C98FB0|nr:MULTISPECIES: rhombotarget A [Acinetobacter]UTO20510.1 rhombotarget A [Acinetobacter sp. Z1]